MSSLPPLPPLPPLASQVGGLLADLKARLSAGPGQGPGAVWGEWVLPALMRRLTLFLNHVLASEPQALARLKPHAGSSIALRLDQPPAWWPRLPVQLWRITPAGLLEWCEPSENKTVELGASADLRLRLDASDPVGTAKRFASREQSLVGSVQIEGNAQLAADVAWLISEVRWDVAADVQKIFGPVLAQQLVQVGQALRRGVGAAWPGNKPQAEPGTKTGTKTQA